MKKRFFLSCVLALLSIAHSYGISFEVDGIYYNQLPSETDKVEVISGTNKYAGTVTIPATVTYSEKTYDVVRIGYNAFDRCTELTGISIPSSITSIGISAFNECSGLNSIFIPDNIISIEEDAFRNMAWYNSLPEGLVYAGKVLYRYKGIVPENFVLDVAPGTLGIARRAFIDCANLIQVTIAESVVHIGTSAFDGCANLKTVNFNAINAINGEYHQTGYENYLLNGILLDCHSLSTINIGENVQTLSSSIFRGCSGLFSVNIPESVTRIGHGAFRDCIALETVNFNAVNCTTPSSAYHIFENCPSLSTVNFGENVTKISNYLFSGCGGLTSITIPEKITFIGSYPFTHCSNLTTVNYNAINCKTDGFGVFGSDSPIKNLNIGEHVKNIPKSIFSDCTQLTSLNLSNSIISIEEDAFYNCVKLADHLLLPPSLTTIGESAFYNCKSLTSVTIPESVTSISSAFYGCTGLTTINYNAVNSNSSNAFSGSPNISTVNIGENVETLSGSIFYQCKKLVSVTIPEKVNSIGLYAFYGCTALTTVNYNAISASASGDTQISREYSQIFNGCTALRTVNFGETVQQIPSGIFWGCSGIASLNLPENLMSIGSYAFYQCSNIAGELIIPATVTSIGNSAFCYCSSIVGLTIPASISVLGEYVFYNCSSLLNITSMNPTPPMCNNNTFDGVNISTCALHVPFGSKELYEKARAWRDFYTILDDLDFRQEQTIDFQEFSTKIYGEEDIILPEKTDKDLIISYESSNTQVATITGNIVTIVGAGTSDITATQAGDNNYLPAEPVTHTFTIDKATQSIDFQVISNLTEGEEYTLQAIATSGLPVTYTVGDESIIELIQNAVIRILKDGETTVGCYQAGNSNYYPAEPVVQTVKILPTSINAPVNQDIRIYPTAVKQNGTIYIKESSGAMLEIFTLNGTLVREVQITDNVFTISAPSNQGIYFLKITGKKGEQTNVKIIVMQL